MVKQTKVIPMYITANNPLTETITVQCGFEPKTMRIIVNQDLSTPCWITTSIIDGQVYSPVAIQTEYVWELNPSKQINNTRQTFSVESINGVATASSVDILITAIFTD